MGAPACWYLAKNGYRVLGLEQQILTGIRNKYFPGSAENVLTLKTCMYNNSADARPHHRRKE
jgi:hypothetical protein